MAPTRRPRSLPSQIGGGGGRRDATGLPRRRRRDRRTHLSRRPGWFARGSRTGRRGEDGAADEFTELAVTFPLRLVEILVHGGFLREIWLGLLILQNIRRFVAGEARLEK